ncbi:hypothetical protein EPUS_02462 [Endocarpon pusillum Z07020]|uniref:Branched-chain-amino-acid aminotransferase n=1 Tax=Endocarpon pusillum (strain Z07020 / HMAS-L-300199) TaxID=1263415 RepID=U1GFS9_ENDPU|nr:uncharacterized protein EPUS_02462 [Endocarpon pusillum Z07020]ERF70596.1 hypothetical protein EPUS_02462 [Endocarpon pusillum Z07020]
MSMTRSTSNTTIFPPTPDRSQSATPTSVASKVSEPAPNHTHTTPPCNTNSFLASKLTITHATNPLPVPLPNSPEMWSQKCHTDHMLTCSWSALTGWSDPAIVPFAPLTLSPMSSVLHYATECFEGMKAYRSSHDGRLRLFRPQRNCERMLKSATRVALPGFEPAELRGCIEKFVALEGPRWLPRTERDGEAEPASGSYLYLRPTMIGTGDALGVQRPTGALFFLVAVCFPPLDEPQKAVLPPQAATHTASLPPPLAPLAGVVSTPPPKTDLGVSEAGMRLLASSTDSFGNAKVGANYGPSLVAQGEARAQGYHQILWLFGAEGYVTEAGGSNFMVIWRTKRKDGGAGRLQLVTAPLGDGVILDGVTRASVLELVRERWATTVRPSRAGEAGWRSAGQGEGTVEVEMEMEMEVVERRFTMAEIVEASEEGRGCSRRSAAGPLSLSRRWRRSDFEGWILSCR